MNNMSKPVPPISTWSPESENDIILAKAKVL